MEKRTFVDQMQREVFIHNPPKRIVSLVPSLTEFLHFLGLDQEVVGITKFCIHPELWFKNKERIGGTKKLKIQRVIDLQPDLVIGNKEENTIEDVVELEQHVPVWMSDVNTWDDAIDMVHKLGPVLSKERLCEKLKESIEELYSGVQSIGNNKSVLYFIWNNPLYVAGQGTFICSMLEKIGFRNACTFSRYPSLDDIPAVCPHYIFLSSEPYPFKKKHIAEFSARFPTSKIILVDGEMFSWYGSRMLLALDYFKNNLKQKL